MLRIVVFIFCVGLMGCGPTKGRTIKQNTVVKDSTVTEVRYQKFDTVITVPGDTLRVRIPYREVHQTPKSFDRNGQRLTISKDKSGVLSIDCITAEMERLITLQNEIRETLRTIESGTQQTITVPERYVPWHTKALAWLGGILLLVIGVGILTKIIK